MDWEQIRTEYITGSDSYRQLAEKYGVGLSDVGDHGAQEGWVAQRKQYRDKVRTKTMEKMANREAGQVVKRVAKVGDLADKLLCKLERAIDGDDLDAKAIRSLTASLRDLQEIKGDKPELDRREQEARIANLKRQAERGSDGPSTITVQLGGLEQYAK